MKQYEAAEEKRINEEKENSMGWDELKPTKLRSILFSALCPKEASGKDFSYLIYEVLNITWHRIQ